MWIRFQEENLQEDLEDYFDVSNCAEGPEILADMFLDKRTIEMVRKSLRNYFTVMVIICICIIRK